MTVLPAISDICKCQIIFFYFHGVEYYLRGVKFQSLFHTERNAGCGNTALQFHKVEL